MNKQLKDAVSSLLDEIWDLSVRIVHEQADPGINRHWWLGKVRRIREIMDKVEQAINKS
jgi:hypothetical protein